MVGVETLLGILPRQWLKRKRWGGSEMEMVKESRDGDGQRVLSGRSSWSPEPNAGAEVAWHS